MPFYPQIEDQCGPASLATMLAARDIAVDPQTLRGKVYIPGKQGAVTTEMVARARRYGLLVYRLRGDYAAIVEEVAAGNPVLVLQNLGFAWAPRWHYSVVTGYDLARGVVVLRSGDEAAREIGVELFLRTWERADRWSVVMVLPQQLPATAQPTTFVRAASDLEQVGELEAAAAAYAVAMATWPDAAAARFGAANVAYASGDYGRAADLFQAYLDLRPQSAAGWNNLAYSLMQGCCVQPALAAARCAQALEPGNGLYQASLEELQARAAVPRAAPCSCAGELQIECGAAR